jgi:FAD:protein FMN transferase
MDSSVTRRRAIGITAAAAGLTLVPLGRAARAEANLVTWRGHVMGAFASLRIHHTDKSVAERLVRRAVSEVRRLEQIFSLHRNDSALVALNRSGVLPSPSQELVLLLDECRRYWELTGGAFDPTVQALWTLYGEHFSKHGHDPAGPPADVLRAALDKVGFRHVVFDRNRVVLGRRGMSLTLNGIAQGYATDSVVAILRAAGIERSLVDMGESRAVGARDEGVPWRIGVADPDAPDRVGETLDVIDKAVATSGAYGFRFDADGRFNHLLDPKSGESARLYKSVTVIASTATAADGLSTAFSLMPREGIERALRTLRDGQVRLMTALGERIVLSAPRA